MMTPRPNLDPRLISEFTKRGITEAKAIQLIADSKPGQDLVAQLELTDNIIEHAGFTIKNPPGFYIRQIERNMPVPENFETSAKRNVRAEAERKDTERRASEEARQFLEDEYERYCIIETDRYVAEHPDIYAPIREAKLQEERRWSTGFSLSSTETMATISAKYEIRKRIPLLTFDEFVERRKQGSEPPLTETIPAVAAEPAVSVPDDLLAAEELREAKISTTTHSQENSPSASEVAKAIEPLAPGPLMIEVVSDPLTEEISEPPMAEAA